MAGGEGCEKVRVMGDRFNSNIESIKFKKFNSCSSFLLTGFKD
jgi:hypothetical protein